MSRIILCWSGGEAVLKEYKRAPLFHSLEKTAEGIAEDFFGHGRWAWVQDSEWPAIEGPGALLLLTGPRKKEVWL